jgi:hypothetical protein
MRTKILLLLAIFFCIAITTNAQINKDKVLLGGGIGYYKTSNPPLQYFYSNLQIGKVIGDNIVIGIIGTYSSNNYSYTVSSPNKTRGYSTGIFYRKYKKLGDKFYFFGELDASYQHSKNESIYFSNVSQSLNAKSGGVSISFIPGISYSVWKKMQMELSIPGLANLSYARVTTINSSLPPSILPQKNDIYSAGINLNSNLLSNFAIGFKFLLGK